MIEIMLFALALLVTGHCAYEKGRTRGYIDGLNDGCLAMSRAKP